MAKLFTTTASNDVRDFKLSSNTLKIELKGSEKAFKAMNDLYNGTFDLVRVGFNDSLKIMKKEMKAECPVDTGLLEKSIKVLMNKKRSRFNFDGTVGPDGSAVNSQGIPYDKFVIFGTSRVKANNFILRGFNKSKPKIKGIFSDIVRDINVAITRNGKFRKITGINKIEQDVVTFR